MNKTIATAAFALLLAGCNHSVDSVAQAINASTQGHPQKAEVLNSLHDAGILNTPGDVKKMITLFEMSCPLMGISGPATPQRVQAQLTRWQVNVTLAQAQTLQIAQRDYCALL